MLSVNILTVAKMKKGFKSSIGCNLNKDKFNHLLAPFTSTPIIGTKTNSEKNIIEDIYKIKDKMCAKKSNLYFEFAKNNFYYQAKLITKKVNN